MWTFELKTGFKTFGVSLKRHNSFLTHRKLLNYTFGTSFANQAGNIRYNFAYWLFEVASTIVWSHTHELLSLEIWKVFEEKNCTAWTLTEIDMLQCSGMNDFPSYRVSGLIIEVIKNPNVMEKPKTRTGLGSGPTFLTYLLMLMQQIFSRLGKLGNRIINLKGFSQTAIQGK